MAHPAVSNIFENAGGPDGWIGTFPTDQEAGYYVDKLLLCICGGIPWQAYFQRVLACRTPRIAQILSFCAAIGCIVMVAPAIFIGAVAKSTDWNQTDYALYWPVPIEPSNYKMILPLVLQFLTPMPVAVIGLGAVSAAVMSSADSSLMSAASMFAHNIYQPIREAISGKPASQREILWTMRISILTIGALATLVAIVIKSIYYLFVLCSDLVYVVAFPQLVCVIYLPFANTYGSIAGYIVAFVFRLLGGEPMISLPPAIKYPMYDEAHGTQNFPFKTMSMVFSLCTIVCVSYLFDWLYKRGSFTEKHDILNYFHKNPDKEEPKQELKEHELKAQELKTIPL